jgi:hypothetical protein
MPLGSVERSKDRLDAALTYIRAHYKAEARSEADFMINRVIEVSESGDCREYEWPSPAE